MSELGHSYMNKKFSMAIDQEKKSLILKEGDEKSEFLISSILEITIIKSRGKLNSLYYGVILFFAGSVGIVEGGIGSSVSAILILILLIAVVLIYRGIAPRYYLKIITGSRSVERRVKPSNDLSEFIKKINLLIRADHRSAIKGDAGG